MRCFIVSVTFIHKALQIKIATFLVRVFFGIPSFIIQTKNCKQYADFYRSSIKKRKEKNEICMIATNDILIRLVSHSVSKNFHPCYIYLFALHLEMTYM